MSANKELRARLIDTQLEALLTHLENGKHLTMHDRAEAAKATSALVMVAHLENGDLVDISVVRETASLEDHLAWLESVDSEAEEN